VINNGIVSFYPEQNWFGTENVVFSGSDEEFSVNSNAVVLSVTDRNEPPEFGIISCQNSINEDVEYNCILNATDEEGDAFWFSVVDENNLECDVDENILDYVSYRDYNGQASCLIRVSDNEGYNEFLLKVNVLPVNDAPRIVSSEPAESSVRILEGGTKLFSINALDVDSSINLSWFLDDVNLGISGNGYLFNQGKGNYKLEVKINDGESEVSRIWSVFVGDISDFTCTEIRAYLCRENEICSPSTNLLGVKDTDNCCSVPCSPKFGDERCEEKNDNIEIDIQNPDENDDFKMGEKINLKLKIKNRFEEDLSFDVEAYLYDIDDDEEIEKYEDSVDIDEDKSEILEFEIEIPKDLEENEYAIFIKVIDDENYCNDEYTKINIERKKNDVVIEDFKIEPEDALCGDYVSVQTKLKNFGTKDEMVYIVIENEIVLV